MTAPTVEELLEAYAPSGGRDDLDWADVIARAERGGERPVRRRSRRPLLVAALLAALLLLLLATPAFGLRQALLDLVTREESSGREDISFTSGEQAPLATKRRFAELPVPGPPWMNARVLAEQARRLVVGTGGRERVLMLAPTSRGGFCYRLQDAGGNCQRNSRTAAEIGAATWWYHWSELPGDRILVRKVTGTVLDDRIVRLRLEFNDGHSVDLRFVWVSAPIRAGFFAYDVPSDRQEEPRGPVAVTGLDARDNVVYRREAIEYPQPTPDLPIPGRRRPPRMFETEPPAFLLPPFTTASAHGATIKVGQAGVLLLDLRRLEPRLRAVLRGRLVAFGCFRLVTRFGVTDAREYKGLGELGETVGAQFRDLHPFDGCDIDVLEPEGQERRSVVAFAFTERGKRHFADRAAARDLAALVTDVRQLARLDGERFTRELASRHGGRLVRLANARGRPPAGKLGYFAASDSVTFVRVSETGRRFFVELGDGRVVRKYLGRLAWIR